MNDNNGTFQDWHLKLWGEAIDASKATLLPMPNEEDDDNHDVIATTTIAGEHTSVTPVPSPTSLESNPTDHPDRPVNAKPTGTTEEEEQSTATGEPTASATPSSWLPSFFPTFGVSSKTLIWIYGAVALIIAFCIGLGIYFYIARRKRLRNNPRDDYEFDIIRDDEAEGLTGHGGGNVGTKGRGKRRAGELYDAFASGSEDDNEEQFSDDERIPTGYREQHVIADSDDEDADRDEGEKDEARRLQK